MSLNFSKLDHESIELYVQRLHFVGLRLFDFYKLKIRPDLWQYSLLAFSGFAASAVITNLTAFLLLNGITLQVGTGDQSPILGSGADISQQTVLSEALVESIVKRNIFNKTGELPDDETVSEEEAEATGILVKSSLPLKLVGVIYGGSPFSGSAMIENKDKKVSTFVVGDSVDTDVTVSEILLSRVILRRGGRREYIELDRKELIRSERQKRNQKVAATTGGVAKIAVAPADKSYKEEGFERDGNKMVMSEDYKNRLLTEDFTKVLQDAKASPYVVDGQVQGFLLTRIREDSVYRKAGLENGDIVKEINGVRLRNAQSAIRHLQTLRNAREIEIVVERGGSPMTFTLGIP